MKLTRIFIALVSVLMAFQVAGAKDSFRDIKERKSGPIEIVSDKMEAYNDQRMVVFTGNVMATEADRVIKSDVMHLYYKKEGGKKSSKAPQGSGDLERIEVKGNVRITQGTKIVTGEKAVYLNDDQKIIVTGNAIMRDGDNVIKGDKVVVYLNEDRGTVESRPGGRVSATINPDNHDKRGK